MPTSPLKVSLFDIDSSYVYPYFAQNWSFFAPNPIDRNRILVCRGRYVEPNSDKILTSQWVDVTDPLIDDVRRDRLGPLSLIELMVANSVQGYSTVLAEDPRSQIRRNGSVYLKTIVSSDIDPNDLTVLTRMSAAYLLSSFPRTRFVSIQVGILTHIFPRFNDRLSNDNGNKNNEMIRVSWRSMPELSAFSAAAQSGVARSVQFHSYHAIGQ